MLLLVSKLHLVLDELCVGVIVNEKGTLAVGIGDISEHVDISVCNSVAEVDLVHFQRVECLFACISHWRINTLLFIGTCPFE